MWHRGIKVADRIKDDNQVTLKQIIQDNPGESNAITKSLNKKSYSHSDVLGKTAPAFADFEDGKEPPVFLSYKFFGNLLQQQQETDTSDY